jgi:hypothetical protein
VIAEKQHQGRDRGEDGGDDATHAAPFVSCMPGSRWVSGQ